MTSRSDPEKPRDRKIVGVASKGNALGLIIVVLCDDGTMWEEHEEKDFRYAGTVTRRWRRYYTSIPQTDVVE